MGTSRSTWNFGSNCQTIDTDLDDLEWRNNPYATDSQWLKIDLLCPYILSPSSSLRLLVKTNPPCSAVSLRQLSSVLTFSAARQSAVGTRQRLRHSPLALRRPHSAVGKEHFEDQVHVLKLLEPEVPLLSRVSSRYVLFAGVFLRGNMPVIICLKKY